MGQERLKQFEDELAITDQLAADLQEALERAVAHLPVGEFRGEDLRHAVQEGKKTFRRLSKNRRRRKKC